MQFIITSLTAVLATLATIGNTMPALAAEVNAAQAYGEFVAYYSGDCSTGAGSTAGFSTGTCVKTTDRHAFHIAGCNAKVSLYSAEGCSSGFVQDVYVNNGQCFNVNLGTNWGSASVSCN